jgi:hypothetical protein
LSHCCGLSFDFAISIFFNVNFSVGQVAQLPDLQKSSA